MIVIETALMALPVPKPGFSWHVMPYWESGLLCLELQDERRYSAAVVEITDPTGRPQRAETVTFGDISRAARRATAMHRAMRRGKWTS